MNPPAAPLTPEPRPRWTYDPAAWAWRLFLIWTAIGFFVLPTGLDERHIRVWIAQSRLATAAVNLLHLSDAIWMLLAAVVSYFCTVRTAGLRAARRLAATVLIFSTVVEWVGARTGVPFGPYTYTDRFGPRIAGVIPVAIPLAWLVIILCGRCVAERLYPSAKRWQRALMVAVMALLTDLNLEFVAWKIRGYWIWYPGRVPPPSAWPPASNFIAWFALSFALGWLLPDAVSTGSRSRDAQTRAIIVLVLLNALLAATHLASIVGVFNSR